MSLQQSDLHPSNKHQLRFLLHRAHEDGKLCYGLKAVWNTATHRRSRLLVVEETFMGELVDDIIEKVLKDGGDVEFVEQGTLSGYQQIALIEFHQAQ
jgi:stalled ribosome rescue protein Dom34